MRQIIELGEFMKRTLSLGNKQHYVDMDGFKSFYEQVQESK